MQNDIISTLRELTANDCAGTMEYLDGVIENYGDIATIIAYHGLESFHKIGDELLLYKDRQAVFSGTVEDGSIVNLWSKDGNVWTKLNRG